MRERSPTYVGNAVHTIHTSHAIHIWSIQQTTDATHTTCQALHTKLHQFQTFHASHNIDTSTTMQHFALYIQCPLCRHYISATHYSHATRYCLVTPSTPDISTGCGFTPISLIPYIANMQCISRQPLHTIHAIQSQPASNHADTDTDPYTSAIAWESTSDAPAGHHTDDHQCSQTYRHDGRQPDRQAGRQASMPTHTTYDHPPCAFKCHQAGLPTDSSVGLQTIMPTHLEIDRMTASLPGRLSSLQTSSSATRQAGQTGQCTGRRTQRARMHA